ncbi:MAG: response regulator [Acidimicrobiia bacterium]|nr:response regulator [Acidimicrobiia bacterium]
MLRRSKNDAEASGARLLVVNNDQNGCELVARLVESQGWEAVRIYAHQDAILELNKPNNPIDGLVIDFSSGGTASSLKLLESVRHGEQNRRDTPVMILTSSSTNLSFAYQSGVDSFMVRPFHANEMLEEVRLMLTRSDEERQRNRRERLQAANA